MPREQRQINESHNVVHGVVMLSDAKSPAELGARSLRKSMRHLSNGSSGHASLMLSPIERVFLNVRFVVFKSAGGVANKLFVDQPSSDNLAAHGIGERNVRTHVQTQPEIRPLSRTGAPRVHDIKLGAVVHALKQVMEKNRVRFPRVRTPEQDDIGFFDFAIRTRAAACSKYRRQTGDAGSMSSPIAAVNVVAAHDTADEFLRRVVQLVRGLGAAEHAKVPRVVFLD